jgi:hypothetical protein
VKEHQAKRYRGCFKYRHGSLSRRLALRGSHRGQRSHSCQRGAASAHDNKARRRKVEVKPCGAGLFFFFCRRRRLLLGVAAHIRGVAVRGCKPRRAREPRHRRAPTTHRRPVFLFHHQILPRKAKAKPDEQCPNTHLYHSSFISSGARTDAGGAARGRARDAVVGLYKLNAVDHPIAFETAWFQPLMNQTYSTTSDLLVSTL